MRAREIYYILSENINNLNFTYKDLNNGTIRVTDYRKLIDAVDNLSEIESLKSLTDQIKSASDIYTSRINSVLVDFNIYNHFNTYVHLLRESSTVLFNTLSMIIPPQDENSLSIKLPPSNDFDDIADSINILSKQLNQILINNDFKAIVQVQNFDNGSLWIELITKLTSGDTIFTLSMVTGFIYSVIKASLYVRNEYYKAQLMKHQVSTYELKNDMLKNFNESNKAFLDLWVRAESERIIDENGLKKSKSDPEYIERLKNAVFSIADLTFKGMEVKPAINPPQEIKHRQEGINLLDSFRPDITKLLENKASENDGDNQDDNIADA